MSRTSASAVSMLANGTLSPANVNSARGAAYSSSTYHIARNLKSPVLAVMTRPISLTSSSFSSQKINSTTFLLIEDDAFSEHPFIYIKIHPKVPLVIISDTGCDEPSDEKKHGMIVLLLARCSPHPLESC